MERKINDSDIKYFDFNKYLYLYNNIKINKNAYIEFESGDKFIKNISFNNVCIIQGDLDETVLIDNIIDFSNKNNLYYEIIKDGKHELYGFEDNMNKLIDEADFIFLCGGHVPHQNDFFNKINLKKSLENTNAVIIGGIAGAMNCADTVYVAPELGRESLNPSFSRFREGLGLTKINLIPRYNDCKDSRLDVKKCLEKIIIPDGSYIMIDENTTLYGECYSIYNGELKQICSQDNKYIL